MGKESTVVKALSPQPSALSPQLEGFVHGVGQIVSLLGLEREEEHGLGSEVGHCVQASASAASIARRATRAPVPKLA